MNNKNFSDMVTVVISFLTLSFYYFVSILLIKTILSLQSNYIKAVMLALIIIIPVIVLIMVISKTIRDLKTQRVTGFLRVKLIGVISLVFFLAIIIITDIYFQVTKIDKPEKIEMRGYREISELIGETLMLGGGRGKWEISELISYINSLAGVKYTELTDRSGKILVSKKNSHDKEVVYLERSYENMVIEIVGSTGVRIDTKVSGNVVVDLEYRGRAYNEDSVYYLTIGFQPFGYANRDIIRGGGEVIFTVMFYFLSLTVLYLFAVISAYYITKDFNKTVELFNKNMETTLKRGGSYIEVTPDFKDMETSVEVFNRVLKDMKIARKNDDAVLRKQIWEEAAKRISHELKNPLTPIRLSSERLLLKYGKDNFESVLKKSIQVILEQVETIERKIVDFSDFSDLPYLNMFPGSILEPLAKSVEKFKHSNEHLDVVINKKNKHDIIMRDPYSIEFVFSNMMEICSKEMLSDDSLIVEISEYYDDGQYILILVKNSKCELNFEKTNSGYYENRFSNYKYIITAVRKIIDDHRGSFYISGDLTGAVLSVLLPVEA